MRYLFGLFMLWILVRGRLPAYVDLASTPGQTAAPANAGKATP